MGAVPVLDKKQIELLEKVRAGQGWSYKRFCVIMGAKFSSQTLLNALNGKTVYLSTYSVIMDFLETKVDEHGRFRPEAPPDAQT